MSALMKEVYQMSFFEAVIDTLCTRRVDILYISEMKMTYCNSCLFCNSTRAAGMEGRWRMDLSLIHI